MHFKKQKPLSSSLRPLTDELSVYIFGACETPPGSNIHRDVAKYNTEGIDSVLFIGNRHHLFFTGRLVAVNSCRTRDGQCFLFLVLFLLGRRVIEKRIHFEHS